MNGTLDCEHAGGIGNGTPCIVVGVDFYNLAIAQTSQTIATAASTDKNKTGGGIDCLGLSLDGGFGFPVLDECCECQMCGTAAGHYRAVVIRWRNDE